MFFPFWGHLGPFQRKELISRPLGRAALWFLGSHRGILIPFVSPWVLVVGVLLLHTVLCPITKMIPGGQRANLGAFCPFLASFAPNATISTPLMEFMAQNLGMFHPLCPKYKNFRVRDGHGGSKSGDILPFMTSFAPNIG